jgi:hypothetical protein
MPTYMIIKTDVTRVCTYYCKTTVERDFTYQVMVSPGQGWSAPAGMGMCETTNTPNWTCSQPNPGLSLTFCSQSQYVGTDASGNMIGTDQWSLWSDNYSATGGGACGFANDTDYWNVFRNPPLVQVALMSGYLYTNAINVNGNVGTPTTSGGLANTCMNASGAYTCPH